jgi:hypothetical protein
MHLCSMKLNAKQQLARLLYMESTKTQKEIAAIVGTTEHTMSNWVERFNWKVERGANEVTPDKIVADFLVMIAEFKDKLREEKRFPTPAEADAINKLAATVERLDKKLNPSIMMNVFMRFNDWLSLIDPDLAKRSAEYQLQFVQSVLNES